MSEVPEDVMQAAREAYHSAFGWNDHAKDEDIYAAVAKAILADRQRDQWQPISTAPEKGQFLAYGSYLYPDDKDVTEYTSIVERSGDPSWPWATSEGNAAKEAFTHWQPLPAAPKGE